MINFLSDLRYSFRMLLKSPAFTALAVLALGLGVGANSAIYSVADALLFRPLLLPDIDRAVAFGGSTQNDVELDEISPPDFLDFRSWTRTLDHASAVDRTSFNLTERGSEPEVILGAKVSPGFFDALQVKPSLGRAFLPEEEQPGRDRVVVLSHQLWERRFGADPAALHRSIEINSRSYDIVGVMPPEVLYPRATDLWVPFTVSPAEREARGNLYLDAIGRLKPGVTLDQARAELATLARRIAREHPQTHARRSAGVQLLRTQVSGAQTGQYVLLLVGAVSFLLLLACTNVANLHYARISARSRDLAIRAALGAGRFRLIRQLLTESGALGLIGAFTGLLFAAWGIDLIRRGMPPEVEIMLPGWGRIGLNARIVTFTAAVAVASGVLAGLISAFAASRVSIQEILKESGRGATSGAARHRVRSMLVVTQMVLAIVLLAGAGLMVRGFSALSVPLPGMEPEQVHTVRIALRGSHYDDRVAIRSFQSRLLAGLESIPGARAAALSTSLPYSGTRSSSAVTIEGRPEPPPGELFVVQMESVTPDFLQTLRIPLLRGRGFTGSDGSDSPQVGIVNEALVRRQFPNEDPIGKRVKVGTYQATVPWITIVGVATDVRHVNTDRAVRPLLYRPMMQSPPRAFYAVLRAGGDPAPLAAPARAAVYAVDSAQPVFRAQTYDRVIEQHMTSLGYVAWTMAISGFLALVLSVVGVYGVMAYSVSERTHEIGVRMALGAARRDVQWQVVRSGLTLTAIGLVIGLGLALVLARLLSRLIFGVSTGDLASFGGVTLLLVASAALACWLPARRASRVDPMIALRNE